MGESRVSVCSVTLGTGLTVRLVVHRASSPRGERDSWRRKCVGSPPDVFAVYRMASGGEVVGRFLFPRDQMPGRPRELDGAGAQLFREDDLDALVRLVCDADGGRGSGSDEASAEVRPPR